MCVCIGLIVNKLIIYGCDVTNAEWLSKESIFTLVLGVLTKDSGVDYLDSIRNNLTHIEKNN